MQVGGPGLIPYRTIQFYNEQYALWQVEEIELWFALRMAD